MLKAVLRWAISLSCGLALCAAADQPARAESAKSEFSLRWALGAWAGKAAAPEAVRRDTKLEPGTRLKFLVEPTSASSVYLILQDTEQVIHVLYRESPRFEKHGDGQAAYIPPGSKYFELDDAAGLDTFFLLASAEPLADLERLLDGYAAAAKDAKSALGTQIVAEIRRQHKAHREFSKPVEKPVVIGGQTRGTEPSPNDAVDRLATEVAADGFYSKTITINH